jgi:quercetin dioxygenase-like cupin family protein
MRKIVFAALRAAALLAAAPPVPFDVPTDHGPQRVAQLSREIPVGGESGWHTHPGVELGYVVSGETEMRLGDGTVRRLKTGDFFSIARGVVHNGVNVGKAPLTLLVTYVVDRDAPVRTPVDPPHRH